MPSFFNNLPPEIATQYEEIARRKKIQEALMGQTLQPHKTQYGKSGRYSVAVPYSPLEGATKLIQAAMLSKGAGRTDQALNQLGQKYRTGGQEAVGDVMSMARGRPATVPQYDGVGPNAPAVAPDVPGAITMGAGSDWPQAQRVSGALLDQQTAGRGRGEYRKNIELMVRGQNGTPRVVYGQFDARASDPSRAYLDSSGNPIQGEIISVKDPVSEMYRSMGTGYGSEAGGAYAKAGYPSPLGGGAQPAPIVPPSQAELEVRKQDTIDTAAMQNKNSPEYRKARGKHAGDYEKYRTLINTKNKVKGDIEYILAEENRAAFEANFGGLQAYGTREIPFDDTQAMKAKISSLKASLKAAGKQLATADGTSIGTITEREWPILEQQIATLTPRLGEGKGEGDAEGVLRNILNVLNGMQDTATSTYEKTWTNTPFYEKYTDLSTVPTGVDPGIWKGMSEERKKAFIEAGKQ